MYKLMNWRLLHPENAAGGAEAETTAAETTKETQPDADKAAEQTAEHATDTKAEAQKMADAIVAKKLKGMPSKDEMTAFKAWQDSQKTLEEKHADELRQAQAEAKENAAKALGYERKYAVIEAGIPQTYADFVAFEVGKLVTEETDFAAALAGYVKSNPQFKGQTAPQRTQLPHGGSVEQMDEVEKAFYARNPDLKPTGG